MTTCTTNYVCTPKWYVAADDDVILPSKGPSATDLNVTCIVKTGNIQFQIKNELDAWFTPSESAFTIVASSLVRLPRANMPEVRIIATNDATFSVHGWT